MRFMEHLKSTFNCGRYYPTEAWASIREYEGKKYTYYSLGKTRKYIYDYLRKKLKANKKQAGVPHLDERKKEAKKCMKKYK